MSNGIVIIGPIVVFLLLLAPSIRLLSLALRTRGKPELWGGLYFIGAAIGLPMRILGGSLYMANPELANILNLIGHYTFAFGTIAMTIFTLHVFHPKSSGARIFAGLVIATVVATSAHTLLGGYASIENSYSMVATNFARLIPTSWAFYESFRYYRSIRRRQALGLADPIVANRFLLWSIWTGALTILPLSSLLLRATGIYLIGSGEYTPDMRADLLPNLISMLRILFLITAPIAAVALSLSFFPPAFYVDRIRARGAETKLG